MRRPGSARSARAPSGLLTAHHPGGYPEVELRLLLHRHGLTVREVPIQHRPRLAGRTTLTPGRVLVAGARIVAGDRADAAARRRAHRAFVSVAGRAGPWWVAALVAFNLFLHLPISDVFDGLARRFGFTEYDTVTRVVFLVAGLAAARWIWRRRRTARSSAGALVWLVALIVLAQSLIVVNGIEAIHYPQFALMAWLLARTGLRLEVAWLTGRLWGRSTRSGSGRPCHAPSRDTWTGTTSSSTRWARRWAC